jgi:hypothetical protein
MTAAIMTAAVASGGTAATAEVPAAGGGASAAYGTTAAKSLAAGDEAARNAVSRPAAVPRARAVAADDASGDLATVMTAGGHDGYTAAGIGMRNLGHGTISITEVPRGARVKSAILLWDVLGDAADPAFAQGTLDGHAVSGTEQASGASPCWDADANFSYEADVTGLVRGNGSYGLAGFATGEAGGADPWNSGSTAPMLEGATLVVIYRDSSLPESTIQIAEGATETDSGNPATATLDGFTAATLPSVTTTYIVADGQEAGNTASFDSDTLPDVSFPGADPQAVPDYSQGNLWDTVTTNVSSEVKHGDTSADLSVTGNSDCLVWVGQVLKVAAGSVLGLGDSVAAGYGLGPAEGQPDNPGAYPLILAHTLGVTGSDYAVEGACAADGVYHCPATSVATQITRVPASLAPSLITLDVGADDIDFSECIPYIAEHQDYGMTDPDDRCSPGNLLPELAAFRENLTADLQAITDKFPGARILLMDYYNPFPPPPAASTAACAVGQGLAFEGEYNASKQSLVAVAREYFHDPAAFRQLAVTDQTGLYNDAQAVLSQLNDAINTVAAGVSAVTVISTADFAGHDICQHNPEWVFSPVVSVALTLGNPDRIGFRIAILRLAGGNQICPDVPAGKEKPTTIKIIDLGVASLNVLITQNCSPHPTATGQHALASDFYQQGAMS